MSTTPEQDRISEARIDGAIFALEAVRNNPGNIDMMLQKYRQEREQVRASQADRLGLTDEETGFEAYGSRPMPLDPEPYRTAEGYRHAAHSRFVTHPGMFWSPRAGYEQDRTKY